jgi:hypothetical protein
VGNGGSLRGLERKMLVLNSKATLMTMTDNRLMRSMLIQGGLVATESIVCDMISRNVGNTTCG